MRKNPQTGELSGYYRLVESYRDLNDVIRHRTILTVGFLDELSVVQLNLIQKGLTQRIEGLDNKLFADENDEVIAACIDRFAKLPDMM